MADQKPATADQKPAGPAVPLWLVAVIGLAIGAAVFVFVDRYPRLPRSR
jgi:hypothetical protein